MFSYKFKLKFIKLNPGHTDMGKSLLFLNPDITNVNIWANIFPDFYTIFSFTKAKIILHSKDEKGELKAILNDPLRSI